MSNPVPFSRVGGVELLKQVKENAAKLAACERHHVELGNPPYHFSMTVTCTKCGGTMKAVDLFRYMQGFKAAGGNPNDVVPGYEPDWKGETFEQAWKTFEDAGFRYGSDPLEQVRFGWEIAKGRKPNKVIDTPK